MCGASIGLSPPASQPPRRCSAATTDGAAAYAGAGYVRVSTSRPIDGLPSSIVQIDNAPVNDDRIGCLLVGPGLGDIPQVLTLALTSKAPKVIDADGITHLGEPERLKRQDAIITPHEGEFRKLFGELEGSKPERTLEAARRSGAVVVYKGPDTLVAAPDGRLGFSPRAHPWLASAGTGDVLAGLIAAMRARGWPALEAAGAGVCEHRLAAVKHGRAVYDRDVVHGAVLDRAEIDRQIELYRTRDADQRRVIVGLQANRAPVILAGACIVRSILAKLDRESLTVSDRGLRHGLLVERFPHPG